MNVSICNVRNYGGMTVYHSAPNASDSIKPRKERMPASRRCMCEIITPCKFFDNITFFRRPSEHRLNTFRTTLFARVLTRHERKSAGQNRHGFKSRQPMQTQPPDTAKSRRRRQFRLLTSERIGFALKRKRLLHAVLCQKTSHNFIGVGIFTEHNIEVNGKQRVVSRCFDR